VNLADVDGVVQVLLGVDTDPMHIDQVDCKADGLDLQGIVTTMLGN